MGFNKGKFGSSLARVQWRLKRVMMAFWIVVGAGGLLARVTVGCPAWLVPVLYLMGLIVFHAWHWMAHQRWLLYPAYKVHMYHHWKVYPPKRFLSKAYTNDKKGRTAWSSFCHDGPLYAGMMSNVGILWQVGAISRWQDVAIGAITYACIGSFSNWLHHTFHIEGHWIERYVYFHDLRALHYTHHQGTAKHNYGFLDFAMDMAEGSMAKPDFTLSNKGKVGRRESEKSGGGMSLRQPSDTGKEHVSVVQPGPLPTLFRDGAKECAFAVVAWVIEFLVGLIGLILGKANEKGDTDCTVPHKKGHVELLEMDNFWSFFATVFEIA